MTRTEDSARYGQASAGASWHGLGSHIGQVGGKSQDGRLDSSPHSAAAASNCGTAVPDSRPWFPLLGKGDDPVSLTGGCESTCYGKARPAQGYRPPSLATPSLQQSLALHPARLARPWTEAKEAGGHCKLCLHRPVLVLHCPNCP